MKLINYLRRQWGPRQYQRDIGKFASIPSRIAYFSGRFSYAIRCAESVAFCTPAPAVCVFAGRRTGLHARVLLRVFLFSFPFGERPYREDYGFTQVMHRLYFKTCRGANGSKPPAEVAIARTEAPSASPASNLVRGNQIGPV